MIPRSAQHPYQFLDPNCNLPPHYAHARSDAVLTQQEFVPYVNDALPHLAIHRSPRHNNRRRHERNRVLPGRGQGPYVVQTRSPTRHAPVHQSPLRQIPPPHATRNLNPLQTPHLNELVYEDITGTNNAGHSRPLNNNARNPAGIRPSHHRILNLPPGGFSNPSSDELENIYSLRHNEIPPPPPPRQLSRIPFYNLTGNSFFIPNNDEDRQRILGQRALRRQNFLRDISMASSSIFVRRKTNSNCCFSCSIPVLLFLSSVILGVGIAFLLTSLYVAGFM